MNVSLENIGKRYAFQTIIKDVNLQILSGETVGISGRNGAGKSTLLKIISGYLSPSQGKLTYVLDGSIVADEDLFKHYVYAAPYVDLPPYFTVGELLNHYSKFKSIRINDAQEFIDYCELPKVGNKRIGQFSSGMQQKLSLGLAMNSKVALYFLDEPTSYLDTHAKKWFHNTLTTLHEKTVVIASNDEQDFVSAQKLYGIYDKKLLAQN